MRGRLIGFLVLALSGPAFAAGPGAVADEAITLLSDEAADACILDQDCMHRLFVHAAFGEGQTPGDQPHRQLFKWSGPVRIASVTGDRTEDGAQAAVVESLQRLRRIAAMAGSELSLVDAQNQEVVNFVLLISDDFHRDRNQAFATLLSEVFAGHSALYDQLSDGPSPICQGHLFGGHDGSIAGGLALLESTVEATAFRRCLHRAILNVLGFRYSLPEGQDSVLSPDSERQTWTSIDFMLLRMLNHPAVSPGMKQGDLAAIFSQIYQDAVRPSS